jgi:hypothetical protein
MKTLALQSPHLRPLPYLRLAAAALILAATLVGANRLHGLHGPIACPHRTVCLPPPPTRPAWGDPAALAVLVIGVAGAAGVLVTRRRSDR